MQPHVGDSGHQIAPAVSLHTSQANAVVSDAVENVCPQGDHRGQEG